MAKVKCVKISRPSLCDLTSYITRCDSGDAQEELEVFMENDHEGDSVKFEIIEIEQSELEEIPEFQGW